MPTLTFRLSALRFLTAYQYALLCHFFFLDAFGIWVWSEIPRCMVKVLYLHELEDKRCAPFTLEVRTSRFRAHRRCEERRAFILCIKVV